MEGVGCEERVEMIDIREVGGWFDVWPAGYAKATEVVVVVAMVLAMVIILAEVLAADAVVVVVAVLVVV